ncbi:hypothetical protein DAPPUDRAFT_321612 [Daphnia pulex]|uniref:Uncharacterized protein n=1 Tax=Daphnia pulex TaxID=6669 RepID=E9GT65_DAPPU|nr:hypothetical protein DAPPUDRAFT_321612 [Daphnia pulex]|eukprot:EFX77314.1 hypothetical protein DAPPUDRAFT_321612 [Daphnia pulex]
MDNPLSEGSETHHNFLVKEVAFLLHNLISETPRNILPKNVNNGDLISGEVKPPNLLRTFFESLVAGFKAHRDKSDISNRKMIRIDTLMDDTIFAVTNELYKP